MDLKVESSQERLRAASGESSLRLVEVVALPVPAATC
jgi:hypothetical protein